MEKTGISSKMVKTYGRRKKINAGKHYFANGKYRLNGYQNGIYYAKGKAANWWYDDGKDWYFFKNGKKYTGVANDSAGTHRFVMVNMIIMYQH